MTEYHLVVGLTKDEKKSIYSGVFTLPVEGKIIKASSKGVLSIYGSSQSTKIKGARLNPGKYTVLIDSKEKLSNIQLTFSLNHDPTLTVFNQLSLALSTVGINTDILLPCQGEIRDKTFYESLKGRIDRLGACVGQINGVGKQIQSLSGAIIEIQENLTKMEKTMKMSRPISSRDNRIDGISKQLQSLNNVTVKMQEKLTRIEQNMKPVLPEKGCSDRKMMALETGFLRLTKELKQQKAECAKLSSRYDIVYGKLVDAENFIDDQFN